MESETEPPQPQPHPKPLPQQQPPQQQQPQHVESSAVAKAIDPDQSDNNAAPGEATLLVSEFPPPPYYYRQACAGARSWTPPPIPVDALARGTRQAAAAAARARAAEERQRRTEMGEHDDKTDAILGGTKEELSEEEGDIVAVFGEIVEDPLLVEPLDHCEDPVAICNEVKRLNRSVLQEFVRLVQDLVHRPVENKKTRDVLSHNIFLMLKESNKFREHQAREVLIELLETQLTQRKSLLLELQTDIAKADDLLTKEI